MVEFTLRVLIEFLTVPTFVVLPICSSALLYLLWHIVSDRMRFRVYWRLVCALVLMCLLYYFSAHSCVKTISQNLYNYKIFGQQYLYTFEGSVIFLRPVCTILYTWQFFEVVNQLKNPNEPLRYCLARSATMTLLVVGTLATYCFYSYCKAKDSWFVNHPEQHAQREWKEKSVTAFYFLEGFIVACCMVSVL